MFLRLVLLTAIAASIVTAAPTFTVASGACPVNPTACTASSGLVTSTLFNLFYIDPAKDTTGAYTNLFQPAFDAWNASLPIAQRWSIVPLSLPDAATIEVDVYRAFVGENPGCDPDTCGGAELDIRYTPAFVGPGAITDLNQIDFKAAWAQSIATSAKRDPSLPGNPYLDGDPTAQFLPPIYPFQSVGSGFNDNPSREANNYWLGQAFLTTPVFANRVLIVYGGVGWGFTVADDSFDVPAPVPEPSAFVLLLCGLAGIAAFRAMPKRTGTIDSDGVPHGRGWGGGTRGNCAGD